MQNFRKCSDRHDEGSKCSAYEKLLNNIKTLEEKLVGMYSTVKKKLTVVHRNEDIPRKQLRIQEESIEATIQEQLETMRLEVESFQTSSVERHQNCPQNTMESVQGSSSVQPLPPIKVSSCLNYTSTLLYKL